MSIDTVVGDLGHLDSAIEKYLGKMFKLLEGWNMLWDFGDDGATTLGHYETKKPDELLQLLGSSKQEAAAMAKTFMPTGRCADSSPTGITMCGGTRRDTGTTESPATIIATIPGTRAIPAVIGDRPSTSCRCCETK